MIKLVAIVLLSIGSFIAGNVWCEREWQTKWAERDSEESSQIVNTQIAVRMIEQGRIVARDEAVKDAQEKAVKANATAAGLSATVSQLREKATKLTVRLEAAEHTANIAATVEAKQSKATSQCSPTCSEALQKKLDIMLNALTKITALD